MEVDDGEFVCRGGLSRSGEVGPKDNGTGYARIIDEGFLGKLNGTRSRHDAFGFVEGAVNFR